MAALRAVAPLAVPPADSHPADMHVPHITAADARLA